jgi:arsenite methyltransferase
MEWLAKKTGLKSEGKDEPKVMSEEPKASETPQSYERPAVSEEHKASEEQPKSSDEAAGKMSEAPKNVKEGAQGYYGKGKEGAQSYYGQGKEKLQDLYNRTTTATSDAASNVSERVRGTASDMSNRVRGTMDQIHEEVTKRNYGGFPYPEAIEDCRVLDLGSDKGGDAFVLSKLVGPKGKVVGVEPDQDKIDVANKYVDYHMKQFEYESPNVEFKKGDFDDLKAAGISDDYFDVVVSNFLMNLSDDRKKTLTEACRVLKNGGEIHFSDIYSDKEIPEKLQEDKQAMESLCGAVYWKDLYKISSELGCSRPLLVTSKSFPLADEKVKEIADGIDFVYATYRFFKIDQKAIDEAGKGAKVTYKGNIPDYQESFQLAKNIKFPTGTAIHVDANLAAILKTSRFAKYFDIEPSKDVEHDFIEIQETDPFGCAQQPSCEA